MNPIVTEGTYDAGDGTAITLEVTFGDGQRGRCSVELDGREVARGSDRVRATLGPARAVRGGTVSVVGTINRTSPASRCSVTFDFGGGPAPAQFRGDADFDADGEPVDVDATFTLR
jgi:hypothetical protein